MIGQANLDQSKNDEGHLESEAHANHELCHKSNVVAGSPFISANTKHVGKAHRKPKSDAQHEEIAECGANDEKKGPKTDDAEYPFLFCNSEGGKNELPNMIKNNGNGKGDPTKEGDLQPNDERAERVVVFQFHLPRGASIAPVLVDFQGEGETRGLVRYAEVSLWAGDQAQRGDGIDSLL